MDFLIASHNMKKREELQRILAPLGVSVYLDFECGVILNEVIEDGATFAENALKKARSACADSMMPCIADDSGLCIDALGGRPGVYSARFMGEDTPYPEKIAALLEEMKDVPEEQRTARFVSNIAVVFPDGRHFIAEGRVEGRIGHEMRGNNGFGYDPIFYVGDRSFAEFSPEEKDAVSHRGNAIRKAAEMLKEYI
ncbi:MAG: RdgB/HAM1 family non-canonical purine NTP pyrophosphatase [Clostridia bacterium]|nr:RdgB/HAM1 family non-canonical purine NTP pyrophosphatase [Clostridia bacterium]